VLTLLFQRIPCRRLLLLLLLLLLRYLL
jgi:hypothetical protein